MIKRAFFDVLKSHLSKRQATVITGLRRVGKTTAVKYLLEEVPHENKLYLDFEKIENRVLFSQDSYAAVELGLQSFGLSFTEPSVIALDEIQLVPGSTSVIKYLYDTYPIKFILTGSSSYYLKNHFTESLAGRKRIFEMYPLCFDEFLLFKGYKKEVIEPLRGIPYNAFVYLKYKHEYEQFLAYGGLPEVVLAETNEDKVAYLKDIINAYIELDIKLLSDFKMSNELYQLIQLLAARVGSKIDISKLSSVSGINRNKLNDYIQLLEYTYFVRRVSPFTSNKDKEISGQSKLYIADTGILQQLAQVSSVQVFENAVALQLMTKGVVNFYQKKSGQEIDFVLDSSRAFEVKEMPTFRDLNTVMHRAKELAFSDGQLIGRNPPQNGFDDWFWGGSIF